MKTRNKPILSVFLFAGALATTGCDADEELTIEDLVNEPDDARSGGGCYYDHQAPIVTTKHNTLWPPNHQYHTIDISDCIESIVDCDPHPEVKFLWVSSDEPENGQGDGNTWDDIVCDHDSADLRAERQGPKDGRVYRIGFSVKDHSWPPNTTYGVCVVSVPHDQSGAPAVDSGAEGYYVNC